MTTDIHTCDWQALLWRCSSSKNEEGETVSAADAELHLGQSRDQWGEVDHVFNILYKTVIIITATYLIEYGSKRHSHNDISIFKNDLKQ